MKTILVYTVFPRSELALQYKLPSVITLQMFIPKAIKPSHKYTSSRLDKDHCDNYQVF